MVEGMIDDITETFDKNFERLKNLLVIYDEIGGNKPGRSTTAQLDLLRTTIVFAHSTIEDFLRSLQVWKLPSGSKEELNEIPLLNSDKSRAKKFTLGQLREFKELTVAELIEKSVIDHLNRYQSYNNADEICGAIESCGLRITERIKELLLDLNLLCNRRHHIVHHGDKNKEIGQGHHRVKSINKSQVNKWLETIDKFTSIIIEQITKEDEI